jgi:1,4-alpha-glucan branching enzyme
MALHKMIRLITLSTAGNGYLNFMGNEFGHPEWIDFPREGNDWSFRYARRQWSLCDDPNLKYHLLNRFDQDMLNLAKLSHLLECCSIILLKEHFSDKVIIYSRGDLTFAFNFHPTASYTDYQIDAPSGCYRMIMNTDELKYGGHGRLAGDQIHISLPPKPDRAFQEHRLSLYLPSRTGLILKKE